ncbi:bcl-2-like protein 1 [Oscarella lobularis]|uniref:bcl-2-like protein 1 n=1 Tax=Oscarella lobularis TaxID=121494 RepID=UPI0033144B3E
MTAMVANRSSHNLKNGINRTGELSEAQRETVGEVGKLVTAYVAFQMKRKGRFPSEKVKELLGDDSDETPRPEVSRVLHEVASKLEDDNAQLFGEMCDKLQITKTTVYATFVGVVRELFDTGINWGRIVALIAFAGALAIHCAKAGMETKVRKVIDWTARYVVWNLEDWIKNSGGWEGFQRHFHKHPSYSSLLLTAAGIIGVGLAVAFTCH